MVEDGRMQSHRLESRFIGISVGGDYVQSLIKVDDGIVWDSTRSRVLYSRLCISYKSLDKVVKPTPVCEIWLIRAYRISLFLLICYQLRQGAPM